MRRPNRKEVRRGTEGTACLRLQPSHMPDLRRACHACTHGHARPAIPACRALLLLLPSEALLGPPALTAGAHVPGVSSGGSGGAGSLDDLVHSVANDVTPGGGSWDWDDD